ncbi:MAG TPA: hypothetical protein VGF67_21115 [Ktedonobacteraceae bacterium]
MAVRTNRRGCGLPNALASPWLRYPLALGTVLTRCSGPGSAPGRLSRAGWPGHIPLLVSWTGIHDADDSRNASSASFPPLLAPAARVTPFRVGRPPVAPEQTVGGPHSSNLERLYKNGASSGRNVFEINDRR